ncbi:hypothetical protein PSECIP111951_00165 [Pseudoalteromonas holothuriae]|uniref:JmjC domain-containing protein n=1 Tax=Pseudoalteromonas holothuriae TaxID=2963714 RepID=A0ABM9GD51_9GAMM|nr:cupin-like domain-containing protein [Pseudoalteromonas sp. CIP111951]CAH9050304.1 hypothetical protein PSECIP111951_00165 [Pseudoalteromonas sp. CIP111951]
MEILKYIPNRADAMEVVTYEASELSEAHFVENHVNLNKPCLIKGAVSHWPVMQKWHDIDYLADVTGNPQVRFYEHSNYLDHKNMARREQQGRFKDALQKIVDNEDGIVSMPSIFCNASGPFSPLKNDLGNFSFLSNIPAPLYYPEQRFFMYSGAGTAWHFHQIDETLMCQIKGTKQVGLLAPSCIAFKQLYKDLMQYKYLDGPTCFDNYKDEIKPWEVTVEEGDSLYIPPFWWHGVEPVNKNFGITLAQCWASPIYKLADFNKPMVRKIWKDALLDKGLARLIMKHGMPAILSSIKNRKLVANME